MNSLRQKTGKAIAWDLFGNYGGQASGFIITIFLARLLDPSEFGLVGMSMVFINIMKVFMDMGLTSALIQNKGNTSLTYSSVFYVNIVFAFILTILIYLTAPWVGAFYESYTVTTLIQVLSVSFFISSFNIVQSAILKIELDFKSLTYRDLFSQFVAGIVAIGFAWYGYGVYALVIQLILSEIVKSILLWNITDWYPKREFSMEEIKKLTGFSVYVLASRSANRVISQLDTLVIGKLFSPAMLGFYTRANSLNNVIVRNSSTSISKVFFPVLSKVQDDHDRFQGIYLRVIHIVSSVSVLLSGVFFLASEEIIIGLFGEKWQPSVLMFQILVVKGFTYPVSSMIVNAFLAKGLSKENFHYGNIRKLLQLLPLGVALLYGFYPFLYALVVVSFISWLLNNYFASRSLHIPFWGQVQAVVPYLVLGAVLVGAALWLFPEGLHYGFAAVEISLFSAAYLVILYLFKSVLTEEGIFYLKKSWSKLRST